MLKMQSFLSRVVAQSERGLRLRFLIAKAEESGEGSGADNTLLDSPAPSGNDAGTEKSKSSTPSINFEDAISQARKEEKEKLYPQITALKARVEAQKESINEYILKNAALVKENEELEKQLSEKGVDTDSALQKKVFELEQQLAAMDTVDEDAIRAEIRKEYDVKLYREQQLADKKYAGILSSFKDTVVGKTTEEVDASLQKALESSDAIRKELGLSVSGAGNAENDEDESSVVFKSSNKTSLPSGVPPATAGTVGKKYKVEDIQNMDVSSPEYAEFRRQMKLK